MTQLWERYRPSTWGELAGLDDVAELKLGRALLPGEVVHHIDGNSLNNHPDNIVVTTQAIHARGHSTKGRICSIPGCGRKHAAKGYCGKHWKQSRRL